MPHSRVQGRFRCHTGHPELFVVPFYYYNFTKWINQSYLSET